MPELKDTVTLPQYLKKHGGYTTYTTGKIYHGRYGRQKTDNEFDFIGPGASGAPFPEGKKKLVTTPFGNHRLVDWGTFPHKDEDKGDWKVADWAVDQLNQKPQEPFFMFRRLFPAARTPLCHAEMVRPVPERRHSSAED